MGLGYFLLDIFYTVTSSILLHSSNSFFGFGEVTFYSVIDWSFVEDFYDF